MTSAASLKALFPDVLRLYWAAKTHEQERAAYFLARALGLPPSYGEIE